MSFQPMPALSVEQLDALRADIREHGVLVPVVVDQYGRIVDGNNRAAIAAELGIEYPTQTVTVADDDDAYTRAVALNCSRRHLTREQVRELIGNEMARRPEDSDRAIARRVGCSPSTVGAVRAERRLWAEQLTHQIGEQLRNETGRLAMLAVRRHRAGECWQTIGDTLERDALAVVSNLDSGEDNELWDPMWRHVIGPFFDSVRSYDCAAGCAVCTTADREWRDQHPEQVYRWLDPAAVDA